MERTSTGKNTDISKMTRGMKKLRLAYNHLSHKASKVKCKHCSAVVRRDGLAAHRRSTKCAKKNVKYDKKKHDSAKIRCGRCHALVVRGKIARHKRSPRCRNFSAWCGAVFYRDGGELGQSWAPLDNTVFHFCVLLFFGERNVFPPFFSCGKAWFILLGNYYLKTPRVITQK